MDAIDRLRAHCLGKPGAEEDHPWGENAWKVGGKGFCFTGETGRSVTVKSTLDRQAALTQDPAITVAPYVGRYGWVTVQIDDEETMQLALELIDRSYDDVVRTLPKSKRPEW